MLGLELLQRPSLDHLQLGLTSRFSDSCPKMMDGWQECEARECRAVLPSRETAILDADNEAGWELAAGLLRPRKVQVADNGAVAFISDTTEPRLSISNALRHRFMKQVKKKLLSEACVQGLNIVFFEFGGLELVALYRSKRPAVQA